MILEVLEKPCGKTNVKHVNMKWPYESILHSILSGVFLHLYISNFPLYFMNPRDKCTFYKKNSDAFTSAQSVSLKKNETGAECSL